MSEPLAVPSPPSPPAANDPFSEIDRFLAELRDGAWSTLFAGAPGWSAEPSLRPALSDVEETGTGFEIRADLPGVAKDQIEVRVHGDVVEFGAASAHAEASEAKNFLRRERSYRGYHRAVRLPEPVVGEKVEARYENGTLTISVPKAHPVTERKVPVA